MNRIAKEGARMDAVYCTKLNMWPRASILTGKFSHVNDLWQC